MGEVIRKTAAVEDILADINTTLERAFAKKDPWKTSAEARIGFVVALANGISERVKAAQALVGPAVAELGVANEESDKLIGRTSDDIWNDLGRPGVDLLFDLLFPGGISEYTDAPIDDQPFAMLLLAELLESGIHPKLDATKATAYATNVRQSATRLEEKVDAARPLRARLRVLLRMQTVVARAGAVTLSRLKKQWLADGHSEAEIHTIIPDRPSSKAKPAT